ncbi:hypothetical protein ACIQZB_43550 [Streptomyces sp. NPDC097727]|uniref:hypothetical protein n=1 Tax=Streptomyces sp. NPDC097727 TaxID=3366092 RepID=UPI00380BC09C
MTIETHQTQAPDDDVIDVEVVEPGRLDRLKEKAGPHAEKARAALTEQKVRVAIRVANWFKTADVSDAQLAEEIEKRRRQADQQQGRASHAPRAARAEVAPGAGVEGPVVVEAPVPVNQVPLQVPRVSADRMKVSGRDLSKARWAKKFGRFGMVAAGAYGAVNGIAMEPVLALAALGVGGPVGWWYLGRPLAEEETAAANSVDLVKGPGLDAAGEAGVPFVPQTLADAGRVSMVKRDPAHVRGEADLVTALIKAGIITEAQRDETHLAGVIEPSGPGWAATIELPRGVKASAAISRVADLASALRIKTTRIELTTDTTQEGHEGRARLWVADEDNPYGSQKTPSPLIKAPVWNFWEQGVPMGPDARGKRRDLHLLWSSILVGGLMGYGKSYMVRLIAAAAALDPTVRIIVITGKTGPDWAPLRHVAHQWIAGASPDIIRKVLRVMDRTITEMQDRGTELDRMYEENPDKVPEGKITPELAREGMGPVLLVVDELQELLDGAALIQVPVDEDTTGEGGRTKTRSGRDLLVESFARYVRVTRFVGGMGAFITQRPSADSVPTKLREVCGHRASYRVKGDKSARMVLGDDAVADGAAPHLLGEASKGVVVLDQGAEEGHVTLKADVIDLPEFKEIALRGRALRQDAGTLTGDAVAYGKEDRAAAATDMLLADCLAVLDAAGTDRARTERLVELLAAHRPGEYGELTNAQLQKRLRDAGAGTTGKLGPIDGMANPNGYTRTQIAAAQTGK